MATPADAMLYEVYLHAEHEEDTRETRSSDASATVRDRREPRCQISHPTTTRARPLPSNFLSSALTTLQMYINTDGLHRLSMPQSLKNSLYAFRFMLKISYSPAVEVVLRTMQ